MIGSERNAISENLAQTIQKVIQDLVAPDLRELKVIVTALQQQMEQQFEFQDQKTDARFRALEQKTDAQFEAFEQKMDWRFGALEQKMDGQFRALDQKSDAQFRALMAALGEFKAQTELSSIRVISALSERVSILESHRQ